MPKRQNDRVVSAQAVARDVTTVTQIDDPVTKLVVHILDGPPNAWLQGKYLHALTDGRHRAFRCVRKASHA